MTPEIIDFVYRIQKYIPNNKINDRRTSQLFELMREFHIIETNDFSREISIEEMNDSAALASMRNFNKYLRKRKNEENWINGFQIEEDFANLILMQLLKKGYAERIMAYWNEHRGQGKGPMSHRAARAYLQFAQSSK